MVVHVEISGVLDRFTRGERVIAVEASTVGASLEAVFGRFPDLEIRVVDPEGRIHPYLLLFRNEEQLDRSGFRSVRLADGDTVRVLPLASGGAGGPEDDAGASRGRREPGPSGRSRESGVPEGPESRETAGRPDPDVRMRGFRRRTPFEEALSLALGGLGPLEPEEIGLAGCAGRILAGPVRSAVDVPSFRRCAMDGYAVRGEETLGASRTAPIRLEVVDQCLPGRQELVEIGPGRTARIMTGAPVPPGADAVLKAEDAEEDGSHVLVCAPVTPGKNVGRVGEDVRVGEEILPGGRWLRPQDVGLLASIGAGTVPVVRRPRVRILVTGDELLAPGRRPSAHRIVDSNTPMLEALVRRDGGEVVETIRLPDDPAAISAALAGRDVDLLVTAGGSSVGREDWLPVLLARHGDLWCHGIAMRPSAPTGLGCLDRVRVFLLPGNPVSCLAAYDLLAGPAIRVLAGSGPGSPYRRLVGRLEERIASQLGRVDYVRVLCRSRPGADVTIVPLGASGASILSSTTRADGFALIPAPSEGLAAGAPVEVFLYDPLGPADRPDDPAS